MSYLAAFLVAVIGGALAYLLAMIAVGTGPAKAIAIIFAVFVWFVFAWAFSP